MAILNYFKENTERLFTAELNAEGDALTKINHLFQNQFKIFASSPSLVAVIFSEEIFRNEAILVKKVSEIMDNNFNTLTSIIKTGQENGELRTDTEAEHLAVVCYGDTSFICKAWQMSGYAFSLLAKGSELSNSVKILVKKQDK